MKVAIISTYRCACGVAKYTEELCNDLSTLCELKIFAEHSQQELEPINPNVNISYERCYIRGEPFDNLYQKILEYKPEVVHTQFETSMQNESYSYSHPSFFLNFLRELQKSQFKTVITFHTILPHPDFSNSEIQEITSWYSNLNSKAIVGNETVKKELLKWNPNADVTAIPLGSTLFNAISKTEAAEKLNMDKDKIYIVQPGFYGADKGMVQLVRLMSSLTKINPNIKLVFAGGLHPMAPEAWRQHTRDCIKEIIKLKLTNNIIMLGRFVPENELNLWLGLSDVVMQNYHWVSRLYSASANGHRLLCCERPIVMNAQDVRLSEFVNDVHCAKADDSNMEQVVLKCLENKVYAKKISEGALKYAHETTFEFVAKKHMDLYKNAIGNS
jgi:glycosyltransferase involved in cell wall biosynthesis